MKKYITALTIGIRYSKSFRIPDISGAIVDNILYDKSSPFYERKFFTNLGESNTRDKILQDDSGSKFLRLNTDDLILSYKIEKSIEEEIEWIKTNVMNYFGEIFREYKINNIIRVGIIFHHKITETNNLENIVDSLTNNKINKADNINISFSKKMPTVLGASIKNINDYENAIFSLKQTKKSIFAELDYQRYYDPIIEDLRECGAGRHIDTAFKYLTNEYYGWLNKYNKET